MDQVRRQEKGWCMMSFLLSIWGFLEPFKEVLGTVAAGALVIFGLYGKGKHDAKQQMEHRATEKAFQDARQRQAIDADIERSSDAELNSVLEPWFRD